MSQFSFIVFCYVIGRFNAQAASLPSYALSGSWSQADFNAAKSHRRHKFLGSDPMFTAGNGDDDAIHKGAIPGYKMIVTRVGSHGRQAGRSGGSTETGAVYKASPVSNSSAEEREKVALVS